jgi:hypothetical protein
MVPFSVAPPCRYRLQTRESLTFTTDLVAKPIKPCPWLCIDVGSLMVGVGGFLKRALVTLCAVMSLFAGVAGTAAVDAHSDKDCDSNGRSGRPTPQACGKEHCNQGVGNGPEGCDPGNSNQGDPNRSNDERGGTPGNPGRKGGNGK